MARDSNPDDITIRIASKSKLEKLARATLGAPGLALILISGTCNNYKFVNGCNNPPNIAEEARDHDYFPGVLTYFGSLAASLYFLRDYVRRHGLETDSSQKGSKN